ncbi:MAG: FkbM family methyltransferase [Deltaproteobacteria bacterium]
MAWTSPVQRILANIPFFPIWPEWTEIEGIRIPVRGSPLHPRMRRRLFLGLYETAERTLVKRFVREGDRILEIGASIGILTCFLARAAGKTGRIVSVEPDAALRPHFERQLQINRMSAEWENVLCCPLWCESVPEELVHRTFLPSKDNLSGRMGSDPGDGISVPWKTASMICRDRTLDPTVVIVDVEGTEAIWARYAPGFPRSVRAVIVEFHPRITGPETAGEAIQAVVDSGFAVAGMSGTVLAFQRR